MTTTTPTTTEAQAWAGTPDPLPRYPGWAAIAAAHELQVIHWTRWGQLWDGSYTAVCPCGRDTTWNAYRIEPLCTCTPELT